MIIFSGKVDIENIRIAHLPTTKKRSSTLERNLDRLWDEEVADMTAEGRKIWNAERYRLEGFQQSDTGLQVDLSTIEVKEIHASNRLPGERDQGESYHNNNIFVASFIETSDGKFLFGRTNTNTLMAGRIDLIGGSLSKTERPIANADDLFHSALSEIEEELNVAADQVSSGDLQCLAGIEIFVVSGAVHQNSSHVFAAAAVEALPPKAPASFWPRARAGEDMG